MIKENEKIRVVKIGEFVDSLIESNRHKVKKDGILEVLFLENSTFQTIAFDNNYKIGFRQITEVSRHPVDRIYEVEVEGGRKIKVTGSHSLFTVRNNKVVPIKVTDLKIGDFLVAPRILPSPNSPKELDLFNSFLKLSSSHKGIFLRHVSDRGLIMEAVKVGKEMGVDKKQRRRWLKEKAIPLHLLNHEKLSFKPNGEERIGLFYTTSPELPLRLKITPALCKLLGFYVAEGSCDGYSIRFSFGRHETKHVEEVKNLFKSLFGKEVNSYTLNSTTAIEVNSKLLSLLFAEVFGAGRRAREKRVPPLLFSLPEEMKKAFLEGYIAGDGHVWRRKGTRDTQVGVTSVSKNLVEDLSILYLQLGINANHTEAEIPGHVVEKTGQVLPTTRVQMLRITNPDVAVRLNLISGIEKRKRKGAIEDLVPAPVKYKKEWKSRKRIRIGRELAIRIAEKYKEKELLKLVTAPFMFPRVKSVRLTKPTTKYAYDITVPGCENFLCSNLFAKNTKHDKGLTTEIGKGVGELYKVPPVKRPQYYRLVKWHKRMIRSKDRNLSFALSELQRIVSFLNLSRSIHERTARYYEEAVNKGLVRGRSIEAIVAALTYAVARELGSPRTLEEIAEASGIDKKEIGRSYRYIARELKIKILPIDPVTFIPRFCSMLGLSDKVKAKAMEILTKAKKFDVLSGRGPRGVAAAAIYIASVLCEERRTQREIADICGITEVTIRNRQKELLEKLGLEEELKEKEAKL